MKSFNFLFLLFSLIALFSFVGCGNDSTPINCLEQDSIQNNLTESKGINELTGKTFSNGSTKFVFSDETVEKTESSQNARSSVEDALVFNYSFNSESNPKTLEFQLSSVWGSEISKDYESQVETAKNWYKTISNATILGLEETSIFAALQEPASENAKKTVVNKIKNHISTQENILTDYLKTKYESVIKFVYTLENETLVLEEKFKNDLSDASSKFWGETTDFSITLNDYDHVIPFKLEIGDEIFVGIPEFSDSKASSGVLTVMLYPFIGEVSESSDTIVTATIQDYSVLVQNALTADSAKIYVELITGESETLANHIEAELGSQEFKANFEISSVDSETILTLEVTKIPKCLEEEISSENNIITLKYSPLLGTTLNIVK